VRPRQPEKILFPPELPVFLAQPGQFSPLVAGELTALLRRAKVTPVKRLQKELRKKEKALAEAAALLLVTKKMQALWGEAEED